MKSDILAALAAPALWITVTRSSSGGRACREYTVMDSALRPVITARAFNWARDIKVREAPSGRAILRLRRGRLFPLTGKFDLQTLPEQRRIGVFHRSGRFADGRGRLIGRFQDARTLRDRTTESAVMALADALIGGDGSVSLPSGPEGFVCLINGSAAGTLARRKLPVAHEVLSETSRIATIARAVLPERARTAMLDLTTPRGWLLERTAPEGAQDPLLFVSAALLAVEVSSW